MVTFSVSVLYLAVKIWLGAIPLLLLALYLLRIYKKVKGKHTPSWNDPPYVMLIILWPLTLIAGLCAWIGIGLHQLFVKVENRLVLMIRNRLQPKVIPEVPLGESTYRQTPGPA